MKERYSIEELSQLLAMSPRTIRYYLQQGLVDKPEGAKRGSYYTAVHLKQLQQIKEWQGGGFSLERIRQMLQKGEDTPQVLLALAPQRGEVSVCSHIHLAPGIELVIQPERAGLTASEIRTLVKKLGGLVDESRNDEQ